MSEYYYLGDPCYVVPDEQWSDFCDLTFNPANTKEGAEISEYCDSVIEWNGHEIVIWSNGGDGSWSFAGIGSFGVDAGIFCVMPIEALPECTPEDLASAGLLFTSEPLLHVADHVIFINDIPDNSVTECYECGHTGQYVEMWNCEQGQCNGCENCFECVCGEEE